MTPIDASETAEESKRAHAGSAERDADGLAETAAWPDGFA